jgi:hypothetical protein
VKSKDENFTIKTFVKPNAKLPALFSSGTMQVKGNLFTRGITDPYTLRLHHRVTYVPWII